MVFSSQDFIQNLDLSEIFGSSDSLSPFLSADSALSAFPSIFDLSGDDINFGSHQHTEEKSLSDDSVTASSNKDKGKNVESLIDFDYSVNIFEKNRDPMERSSPLKTDWGELYYQELSSSAPNTDVIKQEVTKNDAINCMHIKSNCEKVKIGEGKNKLLLSGGYSNQQPEPDMKEYVEPTSFDVLLGRGARSNRHPGNILYRKQVDNLKPWYKSSTKQEKTLLSQSLVDRVRSKNGGRFLRLDKTVGKWFVVSNQTARQKVSQALREVNTPEFREEKRRKCKKTSTKSRRR